MWVMVNCSPQHVSDELYHYGVKGMKWGVRKDSYNKNYKDKQRKQDRAFYGKSGEKRINKKMNEGYGLRGARHFEAERRERNARLKRNVRNGAKKTSKLMGDIGVMYITDQVFWGGAGTRAAKNVIKKAGRAVVTAGVKARGGYNIRWYG